MNRRALIVAIALMPAACATAPTVNAPRQNFGVEQFFAVDPAILRAAVLTDARAVFQSVVLDVTVQPPQRAPARYVIRLQRPLAIDPRLPPAPAGSNWQVFALAGDDVATLTTVRQLLLSQPRGQLGEIHIAISARPALVPANLAGALPLRIDMLVDNRDGWFTQVGPLLLDTREGAAERKG
jgi:hypothetical protein